MSSVGCYGLCELLGKPPKQNNAYCRRIARIKNNLVTFLSILDNFVIVQ